MNEYERAAKRYATVQANRLRLTDILDEMHKIVNPGSYGLGTEPESKADDDKAAWMRLGELIEEAQLLAGGRS